MVGYKVCWNRGLDENMRKTYTKFSLVTLEIPDCAKVIYPFHSNKIRCDMAKVRDIQEIRFGVFRPLVVTDKRLKATHSCFHSTEFEYKVGEYVKPTRPLDTNPKYECTAGIHFFATKKETLWFLAQYTTLYVGCLEDFTFDSHDLFRMKIYLKLHSRRKG